MKVQINLLGCLVEQKLYVYDIIVLDTGHKDRIYESTFVPSSTVDMPDKLWGPTSGWLDFTCSNCQFTMRERTFVGDSLHCPMCGDELFIDCDIELEDSNLEWRIYEDSI
jgi:hypothetical protein